jgi:hypothetical protein
MFSSNESWQTDLPTITPTATGSATPTNTPTLTPSGNNPLVTPTDTPFPLLVTTIHARVFANNPDSCSFALTPNATPYFEQDFPVIAFNPPSGVSLGCVPDANHSTRPFTDMVPTPNSYGTPCGAIPKQYPLTGTPTWQAGNSPLTAFRTVFTGQFYSSDSGYVTFKIWSDDGWILGVGQNTAYPTTTPVQPYYVSGTFIPAPPQIGTPWPTTTWEQYPVVGRFDQGSGGDVYVSVRVYFPEPGYYPFELDYTECYAGTPLTLLVGTTAGDIIYPGPSATPTPFCVGSYWCTGSSPNVAAAANTLNGVVVYNPNEIWAVGAAGSPTTGPQQSLVQHWNGSAWTIQNNVPDVGILNGVAKVIQPAFMALTPTPGLTPTPQPWAIGDDGILHYSNGSWSQDQTGLGGRGLLIAPILEEPTILCRVFGIAKRATFGRLGIIAM